MVIERRILDGFGIAPESIAVGNVSWQVLAVVGSWKGHWQGPFTVNADQIQQMADHVAGSKVEIPVDYGHASVFSPTGEAPAAGWLKAAEVRKDGAGSPQVVGQIAWTDRAAEQIKAREYRYLSPVIRWRTRDRVSARDTGTSIESVALTNVPFLHELPEVRLNSLRAALMRDPTEATMWTQEQIDQMCAAVGLKAGATFDEMSARVAALTTAGAMSSKAREVLGIAESGSVDEVIAKLSALQLKASSADQVVVLQGQVAALQATQTERDAATEVADMQRAGKVMGSETENGKQALAWAKRDLAGFRAFMATIPAVTPAGGQIAVLPDSTMRPCSDVVDDPTFKLYCSQLGLTPDDLKKHGPKAGLIRGE